MLRPSTLLSSEISRLRGSSEGVYRVLCSKFMDHVEEGFNHSKAAQSGRWRVKLSLRNYHRSLWWGRFRGLTPGTIGRPTGTKRAVKRTNQGPLSSSTPFLVYVLLRSSHGCLMVFNAIELVLRSPFKPPRTPATKYLCFMVLHRILLGNSQGVDFYI